MTKGHIGISEVLLTIRNPEISKIWLSFSPDNSGFSRLYYKFQIAVVELRRVKGKLYEAGDFQNC